MLAKQALYHLCHTSSPFLLILVILEIRSHKLFAQAGLKPGSSVQVCSVSQIAGITGMRHQHQFADLFLFLVMLGIEPGILCNYL
jgi:hypothetical protein